MSSAESGRSFLKKFALLPFTAIVLSSSLLSGQTTTFTANTTGDWTTITWTKAGTSTATYPGEPGFEAEIHHVTLNGAGITVTLNTNIISSVRNVTLTAGTLNISSNTLTMAGNLTGAGTISFTSGILNIAGNNTMNGSFNSGTGTVNYNGSAGQTIKGTTYNNLITSGLGTKVLQGAIAINGNLAITGNSTLLTNQFQITGNATGTFSMDPGTNLLIGNPANSTNVSFPLNFTSSNILLNSNSSVSYQANTSQTISAMPVYGHLSTASSGIKIPADNITVSGNLIIGTNTSLDLSINSYDINLGGSWISYGTFVANQGKVMLNGTTTQSIINALTGAETFYDLQFNTVGPVISTCDITVTNNLSITNGVILMPAKTLLLGTGASNPGTLTHSSGWIYGTFSRWAAPSQSGTDLLFPVGDNNYGRSMTMNFDAIISAGVIRVNFTGMQPDPAGLPLTEDIYIFNSLFPEGYWALIKDGTFSFAGTYDLKIVPSGFTSYDVDENTRILSRISVNNWFLDGSHFAGTSALLTRNDLTLFADNFALAYTEICNSAIVNCPGDVVVNNQPGICGNTASWIPPAISPKCVGDTITANYDPDDYFDVGIHQVIYYLRNGAAIKDSCKFNVIVNDNEAPVVLCRNITLYSNTAGYATLNVSDIDNGSTDNCSLLLVPNRSDFTCADAGLTVPVLLTGTDPAGNSATCTSQVTVLDTIRPVINTKTYTLILGPAGTGTLLPSDVDNGTSDNCTPVTLSVFPDTFSCSDLGLNIVTFTARDAYGNTAVSTVQITVQSSLNINSTTISSCDIGGQFALYESDITGGDGNYSYLWDGLDESVDPFITITGTFPFIVFSNTSTDEMPFFNNLMPDGSYTIQLVVTDGNSCRDTMDMIINRSDVVSDNITIRKSTACEGSTEIYSVNYDPDATYNWGVENGAILTSPVDSSRVEVQWNLGVTQGVIISTVSKTDITGTPCEYTVVDTVSINPLPAPLFDNPVTEICSGSIVTYTLTQPFSDYTWSVTGGSITAGGSGSNFVTVLWGAGPAGTVTVSVGSATGCLNAIFINVTVYNLTGILASLQNVTCNGNADGQVTVEATAGTGKSPYQYSLDSGPFLSSGTFTGLAPGDHSVTILDDLSCTFNLDFTITQPPVLTATVTKTDVTCFGESTGSITATGLGGTTPITYSLDGGPYISPGTFINLPAGPHILIVRDANLCTYTQNISILQTPVLTGSALVTAAISCNGGMATLALTGGGGTPPLSYTFNGVTNATGIFSGLPAGTGYTWSITDANSCGPLTGTLDIAEPSIITGSASVTGMILCNGGIATVTLTGTGGSAPLSYTFNGVTNSTGLFTGITEGTGYAWSISDVNSCTPATGTLDVTEPAVVTGSALITSPVLCNGGTGTVTMTGGGGTLPFTYTFNGVTNSTGIFTDNPAGTGYPWSINDAGSCGPATGILDITEPPAITGSASITTGIVCSGGTATITITGNGGTPPLSYTFNGVTNATGIFSDIPAATGYAWSISDVNNCDPLTGSIDVTELLALRGAITSQTNVTIIGGNDGSVTVEGSGGTPPYLYRLDAGAYQVPGTFITLTAGSYAVTVQDAAFCETVVPVIITEPYLPLTGTTTRVDVLCFDENTGSITVAGAEGVPPYQYSLNGGAFQTSDTFTSLVAGPYVITITDAESNLFDILDTITQPAEALSVTTEKTNVLCNGDNSGSATATAAGGTAPYIYSWNTTPVQSTPTATGLSPGTYEVTVTDASGCNVTSGEVIITEPLPLSINAITLEAGCPDSPDGSITLEISGGTAPYSPIWSDGNTTQNRTAILPGTYEVVVTDANGCARSTNVEVGYAGSYGCLVIPQIITPNNDGYNDEWIIKNIGIYPNAEVLVYTRWGKLIYRSKNISDDPWDGRSDGRLMPTDSYHYILYLNDGSEPKSGVISVIR